MGRKLIGLSVGFLLTISIAFFMIPVEYNSIILWLAPYFGPWLRFFLMYMFLIFANPLTFTANIAIWAVIGVVAGLFVRSLWGAIPVAIFIYGLAFFMLVIGGIRYITSGGDKAQTEAARGQITAALIGLVIVFAAWAIISLVNAFFGINILQLDIPSAAG